jgi:hypothetical protein
MLAVKDSYLTKGLEAARWRLTSLGPVLLYAEYASTDRCRLPFFEVTTLASRGTPGTNVNPHHRRTAQDAAPHTGTGHAFELPML